MANELSSTIGDRAYVHALREQTFFGNDNARRGRYGLAVECSYQLYARLPNSRIWDAIGFIDVSVLGVQITWERNKHTTEISWELWDTDAGIALIVLDMP